MSAYKNTRKAIETRYVVVDANRNAIRFDDSTIGAEGRYTATFKFEEAAERARQQYIARGETDEERKHLDSGTRVYPTRCPWLIGIRSFEEYSIVKIIDGFAVTNS